MDQQIQWIWQIILKILKFGGKMMKNYNLKKFN